MVRKIGEAVRWTSSNTAKEGVVVGIVAAGLMPKHAGFPKLGDMSLPRDHESYVVRGAAKGARPARYWPLTSLLHSVDGLTADEIAWCHANASRVRALISAPAIAPEGGKGEG